MKNIKPSKKGTGQNLFTNKELAELLRKQGLLPKEKKQ